VRLILEGDPQIKGCFAFNEFAARIAVVRPVPWSKTATPRELTDHDLTRFEQWVFGKYWLNVKPGMILASVASEAQRNSWHPVREYLTGLTWDQVPRIDTWLRDHAGAEDTAYTRKVSAWVLIQAAKRIFEPGCKAQYVLTLHGAQGRKKSMLVETLGNPWFKSGLGAPIGNKDSCMGLANKWFVELSELASTKRADVDVVKDFITCQVDNYRAPYAKLAQDFPRQCVFVGTSNDEQPLIDPTGNRRFWPILVGDQIIDVDAVALVKDQLWAESVARMAEHCWPESEEELALFAAETGKFEAETPYEEYVYQWLKKPSVQPEDGNITAPWFAQHVLGMGPREATSATQAIGRAFKKAGFRKNGRQTGRANVWDLPIGIDFPKAPTPMQWQRPAIVPAAAVGAN
jgi:putative DNA primase/helicase